MEFLVLKSGRDRSIRHFHPWIFSGGVKEFPKAADGDIIGLKDNQGEILGFGFYSPNSQIVCRVFDFGKEEQDFTSFSYWKQKIEAAYLVRKSFVRFPKTDSFRLIHAEGDFIPGVIADVYGRYVVLQLLIKGTERLMPVFVEVFKELGGQHVYLKNKTSSHELEGIKQQSRWLTDTESGVIEVMENRLKFLVDVENGQKTGFFLDQRENRGLLRKLAKGKKVLNTFSYTGGFSVYALAGQAVEVHSVDISKDAIRMCEKNVERNFASAAHRSFVADCFDFIRNTEEKYDLMVLDPPAFAKNARSVPNAARGYKDLNLAAFKKIKPSGMIMTFSCSQNISRDLFQKIVFGAAADADRKVRILKHLQQPPDHPVNIFHPESEYLKGLLLWVE